MNIFRVPLLALLLLAVGVLPACGSGDGVVPATGSTVAFNFTGLESLGPGFEYEGWLIVSGTPVSTGRFDVDGSGVPSLMSAPISDAEAAAATAFVLTIEPNPDPSPLPSDTKLLGGDFTAGQAALTVGHGAALGSDFTGATGAFIIATPSSNATNDETQGIWWLDPSGGTASLQLPTLPAGWAYEGWVVGPVAAPSPPARFTRGGRRRLGPGRPRPAAPTATARPSRARTSSRRPWTSSATPR